MRIIKVLEDRRDRNSNPLIASLYGVSALLSFCDGHLVRLFVVIESMR